jgi:prepilin-type N-terminal cleavage/methylation domain-containing protein
VAQVNGFTLLELLAVISIIGILWCDGHVAAMSPWVLFNRTNSAPLWNSDHEPHPESWSP